MLASPSISESAPFTPNNDAVILERVTSAPALRQLQPLRRQVAADPTNSQTALALARGYIDIGRQTADPRFMSYAQAVLDPWISVPAPSPEALVLYATVLQNTHRFAPALAILDQALRLEPQNAQASLTKATLLQVQGDYTAARAACTPLLTSADQWVAIACIANVDSFRGRLDDSYRAHQVRARGHHRF